MNNTTRSLSFGTAIGASIVAVCLAGVVGLFAGTAFGLGRPQACNPAVVSYIVRDERGNVLNPVDLRSIRDRLPASIGEARVDVGDCSLADDGRTFYWPESVDWEKGEKVPALLFINAESCAMRFVEVTLTYRDKKMRLIFEIEITRQQLDRRPVVDSLPFQEGTFVLDLSDWSHQPDKTVPSRQWRKIKEQA